MSSFIDYGDDGQINTIEEREVEDVINGILEHVEARFEILDIEDRQADIKALAEEFWEWGAAECGDDIGYLFLNYLGNE